MLSKGQTVNVSCLELVKALNFVCRKFLLANSFALGDARMRPTRLTALVSSIRKRPWLEAP